MRLGRCLAPRSGARRHCPSEAQPGVVVPAASGGASLMWLVSRTVRLPRRTGGRDRLLRVDRDDQPRATVTRMAATKPFAAAGATDTGLRREVNEDRFHCDVARGICRGHRRCRRAGRRRQGGRHGAGDAADPTGARDRHARGSRPRGDHDRQQRDPSRWRRPGPSGRAWPACSRLPSSTNGRVSRRTRGRHAALQAARRAASTRSRAITRRSASARTRSELSEAEAMRHPRRNEVYRDVGSEPHDADDPDFVDVHETPFEPDAALLLCSDGLTDLIPSTTIRDIVARVRRRASAVVRDLDRRGQRRRRQGQRHGGLRRRRAVRRRVASRPRCREARAALTALVAATTARRSWPCATLSACCKPAFAAAGLVAPPDALLPRVFADTNRDVVAPRNRSPKRCSARPGPDHGHRRTG